MDASNVDFEVRFSQPLIPTQRTASRERLKATWDSIFEKYSRDFGSETDVVDLESGISGLVLYSLLQEILLSTTEHWTELQQNPLGTA